MFKTWGRIRITNSDPIHNTSYPVVLPANGQGNGVPNSELGLWKLGQNKSALVIVCKNCPP